ncbi:MAG: ATP-binding protein [Paludibacteraceae bacterium]|nr:ATP-binding protein [Paludibacteraceae bacterium]
MVKFITAPNGYGKTTILDIINAVMHGSYGKVVDIPFRQVDLYFDEDNSDVEYRYSIARNEEKVNAIDTDLVQSIGKNLKIQLFRIKEIENHLVEQFTVTQTPDGILNTKGFTFNIEMFFASRTSFYLTDNRMLNWKMDYENEKLSLIDRPLSKYPSEMKEILSSESQTKEFDDRINAFREIINRCEFAGKYLEIDKRFGFRFVADDELNTILTLDQLSSGEKQMIIQVYELLFHAQTGTLVMIDEPELSLHMMWQMNYLKNLSQIAKLRGFQCIVATHSPQIFNSLWSKSVDLFTLSSQE